MNAVLDKTQELLMGASVTYSLAEPRTIPPLSLEKVVAPPSLPGDQFGHHDEIMISFAAACGMLLLTLFHSFLLGKRPPNKSSIRRHGMQKVLSTIAEEPERSVDTNSSSSPAAPRTVPEDDGGMYEDKETSSSSSTSSSQHSHSDNTEEAIDHESLGDDSSTEKNDLSIITWKRNTNAQPLKTPSSESYTDSTYRTAVMVSAVAATALVLSSRGKR